MADRLDIAFGLSGDERAVLTAWEQSPRQCRRGSVIRRERERSDDLYIVRQGWLFSSIFLDSGKRQILRFHFPGDLVGLGSGALEEAAETLVAVTDVELCVVSRSLVRSLFADQPRLAAMFFILAQADHVALADRLASVGQMTAKARVAGVLADILIRSRVLDSGITDTFLLGLTQEEIGDATGLTGVHVNRMIRSLVEEGVIARAQGNVRVLNERRLIELANYTDRSAEIDKSWLPPAR
ncbi:Crp/Fnr family transcriptional regulator [Sphingomonas sp. ID0503]|uniref:Crp/Fnr family transcriptional regulator n=1 Tax=Sphingomonas sp. ID0503 TaxID=3399691 RepID=UPI003AFA29E9